MHVEGILDFGGYEELTIETDSNGNVDIKHWGSEVDDSEEEPSESGLYPSIPDNQCADTEYDLQAWFVLGTYYWYFNPSTIPSELQPFASEVLPALRKGTTNITQVNNVCGQLDDVSASASYQGSTTKTASLCLGSKTTDGFNVTVFGNYTDNQNFVGVTCTRYEYNASVNHYVLRESDMVLDVQSNHKWTTYLQDRSTCQVTFDPDPYVVEAVTTHERGHTFGIGHTDELSKAQNGEANHPWLTMSPTINGSCQDSESTLGVGDVLGLRWRY